MEKKILFSDLDGTLLNDNKIITEGNLEAIRTLIEAGHGFAFVTGRPTFSGIKIAKKYGLLENGFFVVGYNGGEIFDAGADKFIYRKSMSYEDGKYLLDLAQEKGFTGITYDSHQVLCRSAGEALDVYCRDLGAPYREESAPMEYLKRHDYEPLKVILCTLKGRELLEKCRDEIEPLVEDKLYTLVTSDILLEIGPVEATKGKAVKKLSELIGVKFENCYAAGDEANDLSMIAETPHGIAMANAIDPVKEIAEFVTYADCNHDGVAEIIKKWIL